MRLMAAVCFAAGFATTLGVAAYLDTAAAQRDGYVYAESRYGSAPVRGAVRHTNLGRQVQLPGGSWVYCERSCSETLRANTVDFWDAQTSPGAKAQGLGIYLRRW